MKKRLWALIVGAGLALPAVNSPLSCSNPQLTSENFGPTILKYFANPECLEKYGISVPQ